MRTRSFFAILLTLALFTAANSQTVDKAKLDQFFTILAEKDKAMGSIAAAKDGKLLYARAVGHARSEGKEKITSTPATRYRVGSIAKMFTGTMAFQLVEEGKLQLTDTLDKFFPQVPNASKITIAHILNHHSGIHSFTGDREFRTWLANPKTRDEMVTIIAASKPDFEPGEKYAYSNAAYVLLGYIVEKAGGKPYQQALKERITSKLSLKDTYLGEGPVEPAKNESYSFRFDGEWQQSPQHTHLSIPGGAGAIISTPSDLVKFIQGLFDGKLITKENVDLMTKNKYAMDEFKFGDVTMFGHNGAIDGYRSYVAYLPGEKLAVAYTSNGAVFSAEEIMKGAYAILRNKPFDVPAFETVAVAPEVLDRYSGVYASPDAPANITISRSGSMLRAQPEGQSGIAFEAISDTKFKFDTAGIELVFDPANNQMTLTQRGRSTVFAKQPAGPK